MVKIIEGEGWEIEEPQDEDEGTMQDPAVANSSSVASSMSPRSPGFSGGPITFHTSPKKPKNLEDILEQQGYNNNPKSIKGSVLGALIGVTALMGLSYNSKPRDPKGYGNDGYVFEEKPRDETYCPIISEIKELSYIKNNEEKIIDLKLNDLKEYQDNKFNNSSLEELIVRPNSGPNSDNSIKCYDLSGLTNPFSENDGLSYDPDDDDPYKRYQLLGAAASA